MGRALTFGVVVGLFSSLSSCSSPCQKSLAEARGSVDVEALSSGLDAVRTEFDALAATKGPQCGALEAEWARIDADLAGYREQVDEAKTKGSYAQKKLEANARTFQDGVDATVAVMALKMGQSTTLDGRRISYPSYLKPHVEAVVGAYYEQKVAEKLLKENSASRLEPARAAVRACGEEKESAKATSEAAVSAKAALVQLTAISAPDSGDFDQPVAAIKAAIQDLPDELASQLQVAASAYSSTATTCTSPE